MASAAAFKAVASAFKNEKPHSSVTDWIEILTSAQYPDDSYDGIPEVVDVIQLQSTGPAEASRAIRKKLKHGSSHQQYRAIVILGALVVNSGHKFQTTFADGQLTDAIRQIMTDPSTDTKVKRRMLSVLASWHVQFKDDPAMALVAGLYKNYKPKDRRSHDVTNDADVQAMLRQQAEADRRKKEKEDKEAEKRRAKEAKEKSKRDAREAEEAARRRRNRPRRAPFDFEKEKPQIMSTIANTSQAANNLINAITLVKEDDSLQTNERVQTCLLAAKSARKPIVRYIQLVENEEVIGTLIDTNERIIAALEMYDKMSTPSAPAAEVDSAIAAGIAATHISNPQSEITKLQERQRAAVSRAKAQGPVATSGESSSVHPDLMDLHFGSASHLPTPIRPSGGRVQDSDSDRGANNHGSLSDYSDYDSSPESRGHVGVSDDESDEHESARTQNRAHPSSHIDEDPFADPFAG